MIDVVILNYNDYVSTINLIESIKDYDSIKRVIVVDNCSTNNSLEALENYNSDKIRIIQSEENRGYGSGNNCGVREAEKIDNPEFILIMNPDVLVQEHVIISLKDFLIRNNEYAIATSRMLYKGISYYENFYEIEPAYEYAFSLGLVFSTIKKYFGKKKQPLTETNGVQTVDIVSGSFLLLKTDIFRRIGMYDEDIFLYCEETVIGLKLKEKGFKTARLLENYYIHNHSTSINKTYNWVEKRKILIKSKAKVLRKYYKSPLASVVCIIVGYVSIAEISFSRCIKKVFGRNKQ